MSAAGKKLYDQHRASGAVARKTFADWDVLTKKAQEYWNNRAIVLGVTTKKPKKSKAKKAANKQE